MAGNENDNGFWEERKKGKPVILSQRLERGIFRKLMLRQCQASKPSASVNAIRRMCEDIFPNQSVESAELPGVHIRGFTPDGKYLICFSLDLKSVLLFFYRGHNAKVGTTFGSFFKLIHEIKLGPEEGFFEKTFAITARNNKFLVVASDDVPGNYRRRRRQRDDAEDVADDRFTAFHVIDLQLGEKVDTYMFRKDSIWIAQNNGVSLYDNLFAVLSTQTQTIHLFDINSTGKLVRIRSIGEYIYEDDEAVLQRHRLSEESFQRNNRGENAAGVEGELPSSPSSPCAPYSGMKQRLLSYLAKRVFREKDTLGSSEFMKHFFFHFRDYLKMAMWKMQLLDDCHILIKFENSSSFPRLGRDGNEGQHFTKYSGVFNFQCGEFVSCMSGSVELSNLYQNFADIFRGGSSSGDHRWSRYVSSYSNDPFLRAQLRKQKAKYNKIYGSWLEVSEHISTLLPLSPQLTNASPYLDARLYQFDDRLVSPYNDPKPLAERGIKFLVREQNVSTRFKIDPSPSSESDLDSSYYATFVFHPIYPFVISSVCSNSLHRTRCVKFYFR